MPTYNDLHYVLEAQIGQLKRNLENVPLEQLQTKYRKAYQRIIDSIWEAGQQMIAAIFEGYLPLPTKEDALDTPAYQEAVKSIEARERSAGAFDRMKEALIDRQDLQGFYDLVMKYWEAVYTEAWEPYMNRHCRWVGKPENRWIYCDIFKAWWYQNPKYPNLGHWITKTGERAPIPAYQPSIGTDPIKKEETA